MTDKSISSGERLVRCLIGEPVDRVPFGVGIGWAPWGSAWTRWLDESGLSAEEAGRCLGYDEGFHCVPAEYGIFPHFPETVLEENAESITCRTKYGVVKRDIKTGASMAEWLDYPVHTPDEWDRLKAERLDPATPGRVKLDVDRWRKLDAGGAAIQAGTFPFGPFGAVRELVGVETMLTWFYDHPATVRDMMEHLTTLWLSIYEQIAAVVQIDHVHIWEDMSGRQGSLISPDMIEEFMMPCYDRIAGFAEKFGVRIVSVDSDGQCDELVRIMTAHGVNMFFPFEVQAGNDIREYRRLYPELGIMGGLDKNALAAGRDAIDKEVEKARWMVPRGRYVPGFDHLIPDNVPWENMRYAADRIREICFL